MSDRPQIPDSHSPTESLVRQLYRLGGVQREISRHALEGVGSQGFTALAVVSVYGPLRVSEIARRLGVDLSVASRQVAALLVEGHINRSQDENDGRAQLVDLTPAGHEVLHESHRRMVDAFEEVLGGWDEADILALSAGLQRLREDYHGLEADDSTKEAA